MRLRKFPELVALSKNLTATTLPSCTLQPLWKHYKLNCNANTLVNQEEWREERRGRKDIVKSCVLESLSQEMCRTPRAALLFWKMTFATETLIENKRKAAALSWWKGCFPFLYIRIYTELDASHSGDHDLMGLRLQHQFFSSMHWQHHVCLFDNCCKTTTTSNNYNSSQI